MYDRDGSGRVSAPAVLSTSPGAISVAEMIEVLGTLYKMEGCDKAESDER
jgi:hypothetical protein